ncbi:MAG: hypothetical protein ACE5Q6_24360 [Dehalococcoidia bacterium]
MARAIRGRAASITAADTDEDIVQTPTGKEFHITRMLLSNNGPSATRVRLWDEFTEADGTVHDSTTNPVPLEDRNLQSDETVEIIAEDGIVTASGLVVAQSTVAAAFPDDVVVGVWGEFK